MASQRFAPSGFVSAAFPGRTGSTVGRPGAARGSSSPHGLGGVTHASTLPRDPMRASAIMEHQHEEDGSSSGLPLALLYCSCSRLKAIQSACFVIPLSHIITIIGDCNDHGNIKRKHEHDEPLPGIIIIIMVTIIVIIIDIITIIVLLLGMQHVHILSLQSSLSCASLWCVWVSLSQALVLFFTGSNKEHNSFGASSSDSEDDARVEMQSSSRRPSYTSNYRPEFAAKTLAQVWDCHPLLCNLVSCCFLVTAVE